VISERDYHAIVDAAARPPARSRNVDVQVVALLAGVLFGLFAQVLRQIVGPLMDIGAATAPWVTIGFVIAVWATRRSLSRGTATAVGIGAMAAYLFAWLIAYHTLFAVRESVGLAAGWREAAPWLVVAAPACLILGWIAARSHERGILGDVCLASPIAWSVPEIVYSVRQGSSGSAAVAAVIGTLALLPLVLAAGRDVRLGRVALAAVTLGAVALVVSPVLLSQIHS
jgi:hypothetical protein